MRRYPFFNQFYKLINNFKEIYDNSINEKKKSISFKINKFIEFRNILCLSYHKVEDLVKKYCILSKFIHIDKKKKIGIKKSNKSRKNSKILRRKLKKKRYKTIALYPDFKNVIQIFDTKMRKYSLESRNSFKNIKTKLKNNVLIKINFKIDNFKRQIDNLDKVMVRIENHVNFLLYEYPYIENKFNRVEFIKNGK